MKQITIKLDEDLHRTAKVKAVMNDKSFTQYVAELIQKDLENDTKKEQSR